MDNINSILKKSMKDIFEIIANKFSGKEFNVNDLKKLMNNKNINTKLNNETIGITAEQAICEAWEIKSTISKERVNTDYLEKLKPVCEKLKNENPNLCITNHTRYKNKTTDFIGKNGETI